jgi:hypothetical protein
VSRARIGAALLVLAALIGSATAGPSSASTLAVRTGTVMAQTLARCQDSTVAVSARAGTSTAAVALAGLDATACAGLPLLVEVVDPSATGGWAGAVRASGTTTVTAASVTVPTTSFAATGSLLTRVVIGGWTVPSSWTVTGSGLSCVDAGGLGRSCTVVVDRYQVWNGGYRLDFHVTSTSLLPFRYEVQVDLSATGLDVGAKQTAFPGWPVPDSPGHPSWYPAGLSLTNACIASDQGDLPQVRLRGSGTGWNDYVAAWWTASSLGFQVADNTPFPTRAGCTY